MFDLENLLKIPGVDPDNGFDISPDGKTVVFSWNASGQWELYFLSLDHPSPPRCITEGPGAKFAPSWSPDGTKLAYVLDLDGGENYDVCIYHRHSGKHCNLTPATDYAIQPEISWSPDSSEFAFASDAAGKFETYRMSLTDHSISRLGGLPYPVRNTKWSPAGDVIAVVTHASGQDYFTYLVSVKNGSFSPISEANRPVCAKDIAWSPTGDRLAFASNAKDSYQIGIFHLSNGKITWITDNDKENEHPGWSPDGRQIVYITQDGPLTEMVIRSIEDGNSTCHQIAQGIHYRPLFTPDGRSIVLAFDSPNHPDDLWQFSLEKIAFHPLTNSLPAAMPKQSFAIPEHIWYPSLDGKKVPALLYLPDGTCQTAPAVVYIHGGPNWLTQFTWDPLVQHMVSRGWVVLAPNYRGSTGYGKTWQLANLFDLGGGDTGDIAAAADYLIKNKLSQPGWIVVTGRSYGGYLTMTSLTRYPDLWAGGSAVVPFLNWFTGHENSRQDLQHWDIENFGDPVKDQALYHERSPYFYLDQVQAPVQFICGAHDPRCPASESTQAQEVLQKLGKPCDLVIYPDEGHVFLKIDNVIDAKRHQVDFLAGILES